jgi:hypothetical protein
VNVGLVVQQLDGVEIGGGRVAAKPYPNGTHDRFYGQVVDDPNTLQPILWLKRNSAL